jgi:hypothetical protein
LEDLIEGLDVNQMALKEVGSNSHLLLETHSARVIIEHVSGGTLFGLYESHWIWPRTSGTMIERNFRGISKTKRLGEDALDTSKLALACEPGFSEPGFRDPSNYHLEKMNLGQCLAVQKSDKWPGLDVQYHFDVLHCRIIEKLFKRDGYFMIKWNASTHYLWKPI